MLVLLLRYKDTQNEACPSLWFCWKRRPVHVKWVLQTRSRRILRTRMWHRQRLFESPSPHAWHEPVLCAGTSDPGKIEIIETIGSSPHLDHFPSHCFSCLWVFSQELPFASRPSCVYSSFLLHSMVHCLFFGFSLSSKSGSDSWRWIIHSVLTSNSRITSVNPWWRIRIKSRNLKFIVEFIYYNALLHHLGSFEFILAQFTCMNITYLSENYGNNPIKRKRAIFFFWMYLKGTQIPLCCKWHDIGKNSWMHDVQFISGTLVILTKCAVTAWKDELSLSLNAGSGATWTWPCLWVTGAGYLTFLNYNLLILKIELIMVPAWGFLGWLKWANACKVFRPLP